MKRLLSIELQKIWKNRASRILTITYFVLLTSLALIAAIKIEIGPIHIYAAEQGIFNFPFIWHFNTYFAALLKIFLAVVIVSMMANEYSYGTLKQNLIDGMSKKEFIASKFLTVVLFAGISTLFVFITSLILGLIFSDYTEFSIIFSQMEYLAAYFVKLVGFFSFCLFLGVLIKRSAFALGFLFFWYFTENIIYGISGRFIFHDFAAAKKIMNFFPLESMSNLLIEPITRLSAIKSIGNQMGVHELKDYDVHFSTIAIVLTWTAIFIFSAYKIIKKRDL
ncbi:ABC transporter permease [Flavobacterium sp. SUN046]|uniref:ABC transporter permease n=1 Tax=Flavobacterium sp. SUN046 TaxID=3002440 RepID=UPI002DB7A78B|nr:ABC transporter permease [Flavobacterium sp. SUN046]MEC4049875.1 ABC transporter permease [Flavobacterium sp. SUN046]